MKKIAILLIAIGMSSCTNNQPAISEYKNNETGEGYRMCIVEGCEYIIIGYGNMRWGSHKGNCKNHTKDTVYIEALEHSQIK